MSNWKQLEQDISRWLRTFEGTELTFRNSFQAIIGFPSDGFRSDGSLTDQDTLLAIEIEVSQMNPDTNVGKYWLLYEKFKSYKKIILFHVYTPAFNSYGWRKRLGEFYAQKMKAVMPFEYILLDYREEKTYEAVLLKLKTEIQEVLEASFKK